MLTAYGSNSSGIGISTTYSDVKLLSVSLYAEWYESCKHLDAMLDEIEPEFEEGNLLFIYLDETTDFNVNQSRKKSKIAWF